MGQRRVGRRRREWKRLVDPAESEGLVPAVSIVVPSFTAHSLAHVLADWSAIGEMMQAGRSGEQMLAAMLHHAAEEAGCQEARGCSEPPGLPDGEEIELSIDGPPGCLALPRRMPGSIALPPTRLEPPTGCAPWPGIGV